MVTTPLHPAVVHLPLALALLMPMLAAGAAWALWTGRIRARAWLAIVALQALLVASGLVARQTGSTDEDRVEAVVAESAIERHEELADQFLWMAGATLLLTLVVPVVPGVGVARMAAAMAAVASVVVLGGAYRVGHAGGELVYVHGAASAFTGATAPGATGAPGGRDADDDDAGERARR